MRIGYGRVSTRDQNHEAQHDALHAAGCERIFIDHASGKLATRPELDKALLVAERAGDQLVVTKLDRLGRSLEHLSEIAKLLQARGVDLVVLDYEMPGMNGDLVAQAIRRSKPALPIILFTGIPDNIPDSVRQNVNVVVFKADLSGLLAAVSKLIKKSAGKREAT